MITTVSADPLGDGKSQLTLLEKMGSDIGIVNAARVSFMGESKGAQADEKLLQYLYKHQHWTPFRQQVLKFRVKCPLFVARQWRTHNWAEYEDVQWVFNEQSARYVEMPEEFYYSKVRVQAKSNKQGSNTVEDDELNSWWQEQQNNAVSFASDSQEGALGSGVAKELANRLLPQNVYTSFIWTVNLHSLINFLNLRCDEHAQWEIRQYANQVALMLAIEFPWVFRAWQRYKTVVIDTESEFVTTKEAMQERINEAISQALKDREWGDLHG